MSPGQPPSADHGQLPGQLALPGMPSPAGEAAAGQATLPGLEAAGLEGAAADSRAAGDAELAAVAAELRALDGDGSRMAAAIMIMSGRIRESMCQVPGAPWLEAARSVRTSA